VKDKTRQMVPLPDVRERRHGFTGRHGSQLRMIFQLIFVSPELW